MMDLLAHLPGLLVEAVPYALVVGGLLTLSYLMSPPAVRRRGLRQAAIKRRHARHMRRMAPQLNPRPRTLVLVPDLVERRPAA